ncbi:MAG: M23 family metallopeptidase, partial [Lachnospiraceae bacterium]|nr:M23 family metallopeptidase [Lachnospiraceae bacterium]
VEGKIDAAKEEVTDYQKDLKKQENSIKAIEAEIKRQEEAAKKKAEASGQTYKTQSIGDIKFIWPCPSSGRITSKFGARTSPTKGASSNHQGIDIGAPTGNNIVAAAGGTVVVSTYSYSAGNYVMLNHGGGVYTVYMHASKLLCKVGDTVKQGQVIAKVGSTGYSTGPHLHFGIRVNGTYVNPSKYVSP